MRVCVCGGGGGDNVRVCACMCMCDGTCTDEDKGTEQGHFCLCDGQSKDTLDKAKYPAHQQLLILI